MIPMQDVNHACRELHRAVSELGFRGAFIRPNPVSGRGLDDAYFDPLWQEAVGLGVPIVANPDGSLIAAFRGVSWH